MIPIQRSLLVATVLTVHGIETEHGLGEFAIFSSKLQQCLPFTVLKPPRSSI